MSRRKTHQAARTIVTAIALSVLVAATAHAKDPNTPAGSKEPKPQVAAKRQVAARPQAAAKPRVVAKPQATPRTTVSRPTLPAKPTPASFTREMSFGEAIDILKNSTTPPLNIVVLWRQIDENAGIDKDTPIGMDGVPGLRIRQYLELLLLSVSGGTSPKLDYVVHNGVVTVGTADALPAPKRVTRIYDISDLVAPPSQPFGMPMGMGGMGYGGMGYGGTGYGSGLYGGGMGTGYVGPTGQPGPYRTR